MNIALNLLVVLSIGADGIIKHRHQDTTMNINCKNHVFIILKKYGAYENVQVQRIFLLKFKK